MWRSRLVNYEYARPEVLLHESAVPVRRGDPSAPSARPVGQLQPVGATAAGVAFRPVQSRRSSETAVSATPNQTTLVTPA